MYKSFILAILTPCQSQRMIDFSSPCASFPQLFLLGDIFGIVFASVSIIPAEPSFQPGQEPERETWL